MEAGGVDCDFTRVETQTELVAALEQGGFDLVLADYTLPWFDGLSALNIARQGWPQLPFIFVSGTLDEEVAVETLKIGATDYVFNIAGVSGNFRVPSVRTGMLWAADPRTLFGASPVPS